MDSFIHTFLEEIHALRRRALVLLCLVCCSPISEKIIIKQVIIAPQVVKIHKATLPPSLFAFLAGLLLSATPPSSWWRRGGLWSEEDSPNHGSINRGPDAVPVLHGEARACVATAY